MLIYTYTPLREFLNMISIKNINILNKIRNSSALIRPIYAGILICTCLSGVIMPNMTVADFANKTNATYVAKTANEASKPTKTIKVVITAYSSTPDQTDDTPFITASGKYVRDGIIANNMLPLGTKVMIPSLYGDKVFVVEDRMNKRKSDYHIDIWMPDRPSAINFGVKTADIEILES